MRGNRDFTDPVGRGLLLPLLLVLGAAALDGAPDSARAPAGRRISDRLTAQERRGKHIFLRGTSVTGREFKALFGDALTEVPASALPCVNCHDYDGTGKPEGGVVPSNITWTELTKPYGLMHPGGRQHPPYTDRLVVKAITMGTDPAGNTLNTTMPRYRLTREEAADVVAYLKRVGRVTDPGLTEKTVRIGALLPGRESRREMAAAARAVLTAYMKDVNAGGGVFGRQIELRFGMAGNTPLETAVRTRRLIDEEEVFAIGSAFIEGAEKEIAALIGEVETPVVGAVTPFPRLDFPINRFIFYLLPGIGEQARALVEFARKKLPDGNPRLAVLSPESGVSLLAARAIENQCRMKEDSLVEKITYSPERFDARKLAGSLKQRGVQGLFLLGSGEERGALLRAAARLDWRPHVFVPGPLIGREILETPNAFRNRVFVSSPTGPADMTPAAMAEYRNFASKHGLPGRYLATQIEAYCAAKVLVEGLKSAGRDVSREKLVAVLEGLYEFETGLLPKFSFGPNRRVGALGAYMVSVDPERKRLVPASQWVKVPQH